MNRKILISIILLLALLLLGYLTVQANPGHVFRTATPTITKTSTPTLIPTATATQISTPTPTMPPIPSGWSIYHIPEYGVKFSYPAVFDKGFQDGYEGEVFCGLTIDNNSKNAQFSMIVGIIKVKVIKTDLKFEDFINSVISPLTKGWIIEKSELQTKKGINAVEINYTEKTLPRWGVMTYIPNGEIIVEIQFNEQPFFDCETDQIGYSNHWIYEQILNSVEFETVP
jgi:hypothetical protein